MVAFFLLIVGGLNWGLVGLFNFDLVMWLFYDLVSFSMLAKVVYVLVGVAALFELLTHRRTCRDCEKKAAVVSASDASL